MSMGASYEDYSTLFYTRSIPVEPAGQAQSGYTIALLLVIALSAALLTDVKSQSIRSYFTNALIASASIGYGAVAVSNYVGVYV
ncbi:uncharacterized protein KQ657_003175 [Scheffersomyces spartinae]|uniref:Dolichyl-diphosphooligosaccharide-protein glycosyltransferase subunit OST5 n=1 Tax=Scheffersomyces spartinae TaxID=45513 RepID=A0A9P7VCX7_9ASCO|nr:uncharacterized protein KQ657_003175 [Scheffersomyces spartinae]KAG7195417.1 hypothetical protein KQ657_003175 [Scheffersomyces spartinae]